MIVELYCTPQPKYSFSVRYPFPSCHSYFVFDFGEEQPRPQPLHEKDFGGSTRPISRSPGNGIRSPSGSGGTPPHLRNGGGSFSNIGRDSVWSGVTGRSPHFKLFCCANLTVDNRKGSPHCGAADLGAVLRSLGRKDSSLPIHVASLLPVVCALVHTIQNISRMQTGGGGSTCSVIDVPRAFSSIAFHCLII